MKNRIIVYTKSIGFLILFLNASLANGQEAAGFGQTHPDYILVEAEAGDLFNSLDGTPSWTTVTGGIVKGGNANVDGVNGLSGSKAVFRFKMISPGDYTLYLKKNNATGNPSIWIPGGVGIPNGIEFLTGNGSGWTNTNKIYSFIADEEVEVLVFFPNNKTVEIDQVLLHKNAGLDPSIIDGLGLEVASIEEFTPKGLITFSSFSTGDPLPVGAVSNASLINSVDGNNQEQHFSIFEGAHYELTCFGGNMCSNENAPTITFDGLNISCFDIGSGGLQFPLDICFWWMAPGTVNGTATFGTGSKLEIEAIYYDGPDATGSQLGDPILVTALTNTALSGGNHYQKSCIQINEKPEEAESIVISIKLSTSAVDLESQSSVWIDKVIVGIGNSNNSSRDLGASSSFSATQDPPIPDPLAVKFGNTSSPTLSELPIGWTRTFFWDFGDSETSVETAPIHNYPAPGIYYVCLTTTLASPSGICQTESRVCREIEVMTVLPVELTTFTASVKKRDVTLRWETATETNNDYFLLEHSRDGRSFRALDKIKGQGDSQSPVVYTRLHADAPAGLNYYRLKQVDFDGTFEYSEVITAIVEGEGVQVFPNPATTRLQIVATGREAVRYEILDALGRRVRAGIVDPQAELDISGLAPATYTVRLRSMQGAVLTTERFLKVTE